MSTPTKPAAPPATTPKTRKERQKYAKAFGLGNGFAKALKEGVNASIASRKLQQRREPGWWPKLPARA